MLAGIARGRREGGKLLAGGERTDPDVYLVAPTVFEDVSDDDFLSCEELFGPVTTLYRFGTLDEAIARANGVRFGLSASVFTSDLATFGGSKASGYGPHEQGRAAIEFYAGEITVYQDV